MEDVRLLNPRRAASLVLLVPVTLVMTSTSPTTAQADTTSTTASVSVKLPLYNKPKACQPWTDVGSKLRSSSATVTVTPANDTGFGSVNGKVRAKVRTNEPYDVRVVKLDLNEAGQFTGCSGMSKTAKPRHRILRASVSTEMYQGQTAIQVLIVPTGLSNTEAVAATAPTWVII